MSKNQSLISSSPIGTPLLVIVALISAVAFGMYLQSFVQKNNERVSDDGVLLPVMQEEEGSVVFEPKQKQTQEEVQKEIQVCDEYGPSSYEGYLPKYTVKSGDSLRSIAQNELSVARMQEIIELNKTRYPLLESDLPRVEAGWELYLPPEQTLQTNGRLIVTHGNISKSDVGWGVSAPNRGTGPFDLKYLDQFFGDREEILSGECVTVIYQAKVDFSEPLVVHEISYQE